MTKKDLYEALNYLNASREKRSNMAAIINSKPYLIPDLIAIIKEDVDPISCKASWVLEYVTQGNLNFILDNIDAFVLCLPNLTLESSIRPASKICQLVVVDYYDTKPSKASTVLTEKHLKTIAEMAFDWLIGNHKVAPKAYSMTSLLLLGRTFDWIHEELFHTLKQNYESGSAGYKARARMTLKSLEKIKGL